MKITATRTVKEEGTVISNDEIALIAVLLTEYKEYTATQIAAYISNHCYTHGSLKREILRFQGVTQVNDQLLQQLFAVPYK